MFATIDLYAWSCYHERFENIDGKRAIVGNRATSGSDRSTINRDGRRPMIRSIDRCILRPIARAIVASCDRSYEHSWHPVTGRTIQSWHPKTDGTINRGVQRWIARSIVASCDRSHAQSIDSRRSVLLVLLDLTAAFDTIDHNILMRRLHGYGLCGDVHAWLTSYLRNRTNVVRVKSSVSQLNTITTGVPQGSVLGPILFNAYVAPLAKLLQQRNMQHHLYADDTQLYVTFPPSEHTRAFERMEECVREVKIWLCDNGLVLNENKSEAIIMQSPNVRTPIMMSRINICGQLVDTSAVIRDLGFVMDDHLSMASQLSNICRSAYYHLSRIAKIRHSLTTSVCKSLIHGLVTSRLDYGNAMLFGIADRLLHRLEMVQRSAARVVMQIRRGDRQSMTTILQRLHWLPVKKRIEYVREDRIKSRSSALNTEFEVNRCNSVAIGGTFPLKL